MLSVIKSMQVYDDSEISYNNGNNNSFSSDNNGTFTLLIKNVRTIHGILTIRTDIFHHNYLSRRLL